MSSLGNLQIRGLRMPVSDRELMSVVKVCVEAIRILDARMSGIAAVKGEYDANLADKVYELEKRIDELERKVSALGSSSGGSSSSVNISIASSLADIIGYNSATGSLYAINGGEGNVVIHDGTKLTFETPVNCPNSTE